jgi:hypothetical protein
VGAAIGLPLRTGKRSTNRDTYRTNEPSAKSSCPSTNGGDAVPHSPQPLPKAAQCGHHLPDHVEVGMPARLSRFRNGGLLNGRRLCRDDLPLVYGLTV